MIDSFVCGIETAHYDFRDALSKSSGVGDKQAFHRRTGTENSRENATAKTARSEMVKLEHEMKAKAEILKYAKQYVENKKYQRGYEKAKDQNAYFRSHETQIILFGGAENMLKRYGIKIMSLDVEKMQVEYDVMAEQKVKLKKTYQTAEKEVVEADKQLRNIRQYFGIKKEKQEKSRPDKKHEMSM